MTHRLLKQTALWAFLILGCSPHETVTPTTTPGETPVQAPVDPDSAKTQTDAPKLNVTDALSHAVPALTASAVANLAYQPILTDPQPEAVRYLMRAARFDEAYDYAKRTTPSNDMLFLRAKARVLAHLCTQNAPCADDIDELKAPNDDLTPIFAFWKIRAHIEDKHFIEALAQIQTILKTTGNVAQTRQLALTFCQNAQKAEAFSNEAPEALLFQKDYEALASLLAKLGQGANAFESASLAYYEMLLAEILGRDKTARAKKMALIQRYPATQMSLWPELIGQEGLTNLLSHNERFSRCERLISHFDYDNARTELKSLVDDPKTPSPLRDKAEWELARVSMTNAEEPTLSENIYRKWAKKTGKLQEEAVFGIARALSRQLKYEDAIKALQNYDKLYPHGKYQMRSLYLRGWYWFDLRQNEKARPLLKEYAEKTNDTAVWGFYAQSFLRDKRWAEAIEAFEKLKHNQNPIVRGKALYWQAYAEHERGDDTRAQSLLTELHRAFPLTWYDMLAYEREQDWFGVDEEVRFAEILHWTEDPRQDNVFYDWGWGTPVRTFPRSALWQRITTLAKYDAIDEARALYNTNEAALLKEVPAADRDEFRRYATHLVESYNAAWEATSGSVRALSDVWPKRDSARHKQAYPQPFAPLVESLAQRYGLPHTFIYGIMLQESRFRPWQVSSADAIGALQMIPKTARPIAKILGVDFHPDTFFDPRVGFPYSAYYMKSHYERWGHNLTFTAGSYNGGPHRIGPWALRDKGKTIDWIVDEFSFDESRHYARKVAEHTLRFAYLYARSPQEWLDIVHQIVPRVVPDIEPTDDWGL